MTDLSISIIESLKALQRKARYAKKLSFSEPVITPIPEKDKAKILKAIRHPSLMKTLVTHNGKTQTLKEWSIELNLAQYTIQSRFQVGDVGAELIRPITSPKDKRRYKMDKQH